MKYLWECIDRRNWKKGMKDRVFLGSVGILFGLAGFLVWQVVSIWALGTKDWMICFSGYPVVLSWIIVFGYSAGRSFHDPKKK